MIRRIISRIRSLKNQEAANTEVANDENTTADNPRDNPPMNNDNPVRRRREQPWKNPLFYFASVLSIGSLAWTAYGIFDLLNKHVAGLAVALVADLIWAGVLVAEVQGARIRGREWPVSAIGWGAVSAVVTLLVMHGIQLDNVGWIVAAPLVPFGAKVMWMFTLTAPYDPTAPTEREQTMLNEMLRQAAVEAQRLEAQKKKDLAEADALDAENEKYIRRIQAASRRAQEMQIAQMEVAGMMSPRVIPGELSREDSRGDRSEDRQVSPGFSGSSSVPTDMSPGPAGSSPGSRQLPIGFHPPVPTDPDQRIREVRVLIDVRGGDPKSVPLDEIEQLYQVSNSTASRIRTKAIEGYA